MYFFIKELENLEGQMQLEDIKVGILYAFYSWCITIPVLNGR